MTVSRWIVAASLFAGLFKGCLVVAWHLTHSDGLFRLIVRCDPVVTFAAITADDALGALVHPMVRPYFGEALLVLGTTLEVWNCRDAHSARAARSSTPKCEQALSGRACSALWPLRGSRRRCACSGVPPSSGMRLGDVDLVAPWSPRGRLMREREVAPMLYQITVIPGTRIAGDASGSDPVTSQSP